MCRVVVGVDDDDDGDNGTEPADKDVPVAFAGARTRSQLDDADFVGGDF